MSGVGVIRLPQLRLRNNLRACTNSAIRYSDLRLWQLKKLEEVHELSKKQRKIDSLSKELGFDRKEIIEWFRTYEDMPQERRDSLRATLEASEKAREARKVTLTGKLPVKKKPSQKLDTWQKVKDVKKSAQGRRIPKDAERTMEKIFLTNQKPSDALVNEIRSIHKIKRKQVLDWFAQKRRGENE
eukprot:TRINITY_DN756_c0_g1_i1.p2 TRINITY_DN756_c0_g1~~TRINITY_DN756_c0_g1_i1.p2  ORF type:complete len:185 (-),score=13.98 TRINITY_DN756_c0_g1_i1:1325-1879(-)